MVNVLLVVLLLLLLTTTTISSRVRLLIIIYGSSLHPEGTCAAFPELALVSGERVHLRLIIVVLFIITISVFGKFDVWPLRGCDLVFFVVTSFLVNFLLNLYIMRATPNRLQLQGESSFIRGTTPWLLQRRYDKLRRGDLSSFERGGFILQQTARLNRI